MSTAQDTVLIAKRTEIVARATSRTTDRPIPTCAPTTSQGSRLVT